MFVRTEFAAGAWWQLVSAQWVHLSWQHTGVNLLGLLVLLVVFHGLVPPRLQLTAFVGGHVGVAAVLALDANCAYYAGASGALHGLLAGCALCLVLLQARWLGGAVLAGLAVKLVWQHATGDVGAPGWLGFATYYPAHEAGAVGGLAAVALVRGLRPAWLAR
ncbi:MAG: rhombosortase [Burkholderiales bacterium]|nr:rhombosortase [Burkholderiales bacterium]